MLKTSVPEDEHRLQSVYCLWYSRKASGKSHQNSFDQNLQLIGAFATCEQFWHLYSYLVKPGDLTTHSDFHLFKKGIKPLWEVSLGLGAGFLVCGSGNCSSLGSYQLSFLFKNRYCRRQKVKNSYFRRLKLNKNLYHKVKKNVILAPKQ